MRTLTTDFATTVEDLKQIIENSKDLSIKMDIENRPKYRDVLVKITAEEKVFFDFFDRNDLYYCMGQVKEIKHK